MKKPELILLVGNIGSGKSTKAREFAKQGYKVICRDQIRTMLAGGGYLFDPYMEIYINTALDQLFRSLVKFGADLVIDQTNMDKNTRKHYIDYAEQFGYTVKAYVMPALIKETCVFRRMYDNRREMTEEKWGEVWEHFNKKYEEPSKKEGFDEIVKITA